MAMSPMAIYYYVDGICVCSFDGRGPDLVGYTVGSLYEELTGSPIKKDGYVLKHWSVNNESSSTIWYNDDLFSDILDESVMNGTYGYNVPIYAVWEALPPTITFDANSGTFPTSGEAQTTYNSTELTGSTTLSSIVETPTKPGYVFQGWSATSTGSVQYTQSSMPTISSDTTLYAIYEPDTTKVLLEKGAVDIILGKLK